MVNDPAFITPGSSSPTPYTHHTLIPPLSNHPPPGNKTTNMEQVISSAGRLLLSTKHLHVAEAASHPHKKADCQSSGMPGMLVNRFFMFLFPFEYRSQLFIEHSKVPLHCVVYNYFHFHTRKCIYFLSHCLGELVPCTQVHISEIGAMLAII